MAYEIKVKPITDTHPAIVVLAEELLFKELKTYSWCKKQEQRNKKIKL